MKQSIIEFTKHNRIVYKLYYNFMTVFLSLLRSFLKPDDKLILFVAYGGQSFGESPKCMYDAMNGDPRFKDYNMIWGFKKPENFPEVENKVKLDTLKYFLTALKARIWISNEGIERALHFKGKHTFYFYTTHTVYPKYMGVDAIASSTFTSYKKKSCIYDCTCAQSKDEQELQSRIYGLDKCRIKVIGYPKNDKIANATIEDRNKIRKELGIPECKIAILYAPTFREDFKENPINFDKWHKILGNEYFLMYRAHPYMAEMAHISPDSQFVRDFSYYPDNTDLLIASDILISDYSGIFVEFGVQDKPMFAFPYDYDTYIKQRGLYFDVRKVLPGGSLSEEKLLEYIKNGNKEEIMAKVNEFKKHYCAVYGNATKSALDVIYKELNS